MFLFSSNNNVQQNSEEHHNIYHLVTQYERALNLFFSVSLFSVKLHQHYCSVNSFAHSAMWCNSSSAAAATDKFTSILHFTQAYVPLH